MLLQIGMDSFSAPWPASITCIGAFDGIHLGHQKIIKETVKRAHELQLPSVLLTFDKLPCTVICPEKAVPLISSLNEKISFIQELGISVCMIMPFDKATAKMKAESFLNEILITKLKSQELVIGNDFALGSGREGKASWLAEKIPTLILPSEKINEERVSSTNIRKLLESGEVELVKKYLGRDYALEGILISSQEKKLPCAHQVIKLAPINHFCTLPLGCYEGYFLEGNEKKKGVLNIDELSIKGIYRIDLPVPLGVSSILKSTKFFITKALSA